MKTATFVQADGASPDFFSTLGDGACRFVTIADRTTGEYVCTCVWEAHYEAAWWASPGHLEAVGIHASDARARGFRSGREVHEFLVGLQVAKIAAQAAAIDARGPIRETPVDFGPRNWRPAAAPEDGEDEETAV